MKCGHSEVIYIDLLQVDGEPLYTVRCNDCGEYGVIELVEDKNEFGMTLEKIEELRRNAV